MTTQRQQDSHKTPEQAQTQTQRASWSVIPGSGGSLQDALRRVVLPSNRGLYWAIYNNPIMTDGNTVWYLHPDKTVLYELRPLRSGSALHDATDEQDEDTPEPEPEPEDSEGNEGKKPRGRPRLPLALFPVNDWGVPVLHGIHLLPHRNYKKPEDETLYSLTVSGLPDVPMTDHTLKSIKDGSWESAYGGLQGVTGTTAQRRYAEVIKAQRMRYGVPILPAFAATGWDAYEDNNSGAMRWRYILRDGRVLDAAGLHALTDCSPKLKGYTARKPLADAYRERLTDLQRPSADSLASLRDWIAAVSPRGHLWNVTGAALRSLLPHTLLPVMTAFVLEGESESGKTNLTTFAGGVNGPFPYTAQADTTFNGTAAGMEVRIRGLADGPILLDNFRVRPTDGPKEQGQLAYNLDGKITAQASGMPERDRATRDIAARDDGTIDGMLLVNGEKLPDMLVSALRRVMLQEIRRDTTDAPGDIDKGLFRSGRDAQQATYTALGLTVAQYLAQRLDSAPIETIERLRAQELRYTAELLALAEQERVRAGWNVPEYLSVCDNWARVLTGWYLAERALGLDAGTDGHSGYFTAQVFPFVVSAMLEQLRRMVRGALAEDGMTQFASLLSRLSERIRDGALVEGSRMVLADYAQAIRYQTAPPDVAGVDAALFGWADQGNDSHTRLIAAGYVDGKASRVYLLPKAIDALLGLAARVPGYDSLRTTAALFQAAKAEGFIAIQDGRNLGVKLGHGKLGRGWAIPLQRYLYPDGTDEGTDSPDGPDDTPPPTRPRNAPDDPEAASTVQTPVLLSGLPGLPVMDVQPDWGSVGGAEAAAPAEPETTDTQTAHHNRAMLSDSVLVVVRPDGTHYATRTDVDVSSVGAVLDSLRAQHVSMCWIDPFSQLGLRLHAWDSNTERAGWLSDTHGWTYRTENGVLPLTDRGGMRPWARIDTPERVKQQSVTLAFSKQKGDWPWIVDSPDADAADEDSLETTAAWCLTQLQGLCKLQGALGYAVLNQPSYTGRKFAEACNQDAKHADWWNAPPEDFRTLLPAGGARAGRGYQGQPDWRRALTADERKGLASGAARLVTFDKRSAYLAATIGLQFPLGTPRLEPASGYDSARDKAHPAYWHVVLSYPDDNPWNGHDLPRLPGGDCWLWTTTLDFCVRQGARVTVLEHIVWPEHHAVLKHWGQRIWDARLSLDEQARTDDSPALAFARDAIKAIYKATIGVIGWQTRKLEQPDGTDESSLDETDAEEQPSTPLKYQHRSWYELVTAEAQVRIWAQLRSLYETGVRPLFTHIDAIALVDSPERPQAALFAEKQPDNPARCGSFRLEHSHSGGAVLAALERLTHNTYRASDEPTGQTIPALARR